MAIISIELTKEMEDVMRRVIDVYGQTNLSPESRTFITEALDGDDNLPFDEIIHALGAAQFNEIMIDVIHKFANDTNREKQ